MLAEWLADTPLLVVAAYRTGEIPRGHPLRRMRTDLRRAGRLSEVALEPLDSVATRDLAALLLGATPGPALVNALYDRTQGVPFFIEELVDALRGAGRLRAGADEEVDLLGDGTDVPIPASVSDAVLLRAQSLPAAAPTALEIAAVAGVVFDLDLVAEIAPHGDSALQVSLESGPVDGIAWPTRPRRVPRRAGPRSALQRHQLHSSPRPPSPGRGAAVAARRIGGALAEHLQLAGETVRARTALLAAAEVASAVYACRDAARTARRALALWPEHVEQSERLAALDRYGQYAEFSGDLAEAARAWREVVEAQRDLGDTLACADVERRLRLARRLGASNRRPPVRRQRRCLERRSRRRDRAHCRGDTAP
jgi:hypothetical protein